MLTFVAALIVLERVSRGRARYFHTSVRYRSLVRHRLHGWRALGATVACLVPFTVGFAIPAGLLLELAIVVGDPWWGPRFYRFAWNSATLGLITAALAVLLAMVLAYAVRLQPSPMMRGAVRVAALGYAVPGSVIAVGVLIPFGAFDNALDSVMRTYFGISTGLLLIGSIAALVFAYLVRFLAVSLHTVEASLAKVSPSMDAAARTLGRGPRGTLFAVHAPIIRGGMLTAALLVFVDVVKELPATMILRPFNFDTLAIRVHRLASDERLAEASTAALTIVLVGIVPVILLSRAIARARPGSNAAVHQPAVVD